MLAELESESHRGAAPANPQSSRAFVPTPTPVACPVAAVAKPVLPRKRERVPVDMDCVACWNLSRGCTAGKAYALTLRGSYRRRSRPMPRRLKQRARSEGTEWASEPRCCSAVKKVSARTLHPLYFLCSSCTAVRAHCTLSDTSALIRAWWGRGGRGRQRRAGQGRSRPGQARPGQGIFFFFSFCLFVFFFFSFDKLSKVRYLNFSCLIQGYDKL